MTDNVTRRSLLVRVRDIADTAAWAEFETQYRELLTRYARGRGLQPADADDVCQSVLIKLCRALREFDYDPAKGKFRSYLHRMVKNEIADQFSRPNRPVHSVGNDVLAGHAAPADDEADELWEREWENHHFRLAMETIRATFDERSVAVFDRLVAGDSVEATAGAFDLSTQAVHKIKQRIRDRMRELIARQIAEEDDPDGCGV